MAENSKLKILYILDIMKKTDAQHPLNTTQIAEKLMNYGIISVQTLLFVEERFIMQR